MRGSTIAAVLFAVIAAGFALLAPVSDPDIFWHLASGDWMLDHAQLLDRDVFSFTRTGVSYHTGEWLGEIILALAFRAGDWLALELLRAACVGIGTFFAARATLRIQPHVGWAALPILGGILVARTVWGDRPQLFTVALFPIVFDLLLGARISESPRRLALLPPIFLLWANLHAAFAAGLVLVAIFVIESGLARVRATRTPLLAALVVSVLATFANPAGPGAIAAGFGYASSSGAYVVEEGPLDVLTGAGIVVAAMLLGSLTIALVLGLEGITTRLGAPLLWAGLIVPFGFLGFAIQRHAILASVVLAPFVAAGLPAAIGRPARTAPLVPRSASAVILAGCVLLLGVAAATVAPRSPNLAAYPEGALAALAARPGHLLNEYDWGGFLVRNAPEHPVFVDGRGATLFLPDVLSDFDKAVGLGPGYRGVLDRWRIDLVLLRPERPLAVALREDGWAVLGETARWVLLARR